MEEVFNKLKELQDVLLKEFDVETELEEIPKELNALKWKFQRIERTLKENDSKKEHLNNRVEQLKKEKEEYKKNKEKYESQIPLIKTQREYEAITNEIAQVDERLEIVEEEEQNAVREIEDINRIIEDNTGMHAELKESIGSQDKDVQKQLNERQKELKKFLKEKEKISAGLDEETIYKFEKIVRKKEGIGIVSIRNDVCMGCNMILPPQFINDVRREEAIIFCPNCSRILYYFEEHPEDEELLV
jgi:predicted  nucleic acid-binding Zn-ribbon protein